MKHTKDGFIYNINSLCDPNVYKLSTRQLMRHVYSDKFFGKNRPENAITAGSFLGDVELKNTFIQIRGDEKEIDYEALKELFGYGIEEEEEDISDEDISDDIIEEVKQKPKPKKKAGMRSIEHDDKLIKFNKDELLEFTVLSGYDDVFVYAPVSAVVELADEILGFDGCLNFFAGPLDKKFSANFNFYNVHYAQHHIAGTSGSTTDDMRDIIRLIGEKRINPAVMITHIGGIDAAIDTTLHLPEIPGGKKLIYTHINLPLTAIGDFEELGKTDKRFEILDDIVKKNNGLWCARAEKYLLSNF